MVGRVWQGPVEIGRRLNLHPCPKLTHSITGSLPPSLPPSLPHKVQLRGGRKPPRTRVPQARLFPRWRTSSPRERAPRSRTKTEALWSSWLARGVGVGGAWGRGVYTCSVRQHSAYVRTHKRVEWLRLKSWAAQHKRQQEQTHFKRWPRTTGKPFWDRRGPPEKILRITGEGAPKRFCDPREIIAPVFFRGGGRGDHAIHLNILK